MPLASPPAGRHVVYGLGRIDASGRVADRAVTGALGWRGGDRLTLTAEAGRGGRPPRPGRHGHRAAPACVAIPAALRRRCGLRAGDRVLLAAVPGQDTLAAYSFAVVDQALRAHARSRHVKEESRDDHRTWPGTRPHPGRPWSTRRCSCWSGWACARRTWLTAPQDRPPVPTFAEYVPVVSAASATAPAGHTARTGTASSSSGVSRRLDEIAPSEIRQLMSYVRTHVVARRNSRGGRSAAEHLVAALRCLYKHAEDDGLITPADNPARKVDKPRRLPSTRRAVADNRLAEINQAAADHGDDPELDTLLLRLHTETACRRGGALALRPRDLDPEQCLILLREKGETVRWQPVSPTLMARLVGHGRERHAPPDGQLLRYRNGRPITYRRYDHLWARIGRHLPWVRAQQISMHWIRHIFPA